MCELPILKVLVILCTCTPCAVSATAALAADQLSQVPSAVKRNETQSLKRELSQEKEDLQADDCLVKRRRLEKRPTFKKKAHEMQFATKMEMEESTSALQLSPPAAKKAKGRTSEQKF